ncbi:beta propeller repeat protein [Roseimaritima ulvae]|uniref:BNR/Asp-box repeat protein n=1 Tax=Roseimaritima ulvae TaxID=980254 RepID=A0A5B9QV82_9BACT|nr:hypothetical protein [Roseimaritima ulvae]QEG41710.1 hypothetical protein UC8_37360 [Roseimaritima ulvae]
MSHPTHSRRRFLTAAAATATCGTMLNPSRVPLHAAPANTTGETEHFWYRLAPEGPYIDSQRDNQAFGFDQEKIYLSEDNGQTWPHSTAFSDADNITFSCIMKNGNILFATRQELFLSTDNLKTHRPIIVKDQHGRDYLPHKPVNPDQPGWYFHPLDGEHTWDVEGQEMLVWGNYCNVRGGAVPVNIYYSCDQGETVKIAYSFGQNPHFQQRTVTPDTMLGDATNPVIARHIHGVAYNPVENAFYTCTGDINRGYGNECHWLRGTYDAASDTWEWKVLISVDSDSRYKSGGFNFVDGRLYWAADANGPKLGPKHDRGIFSCAPEDIADKEAHTRLYPMEFESANMIIEDGVILAALYATASTSTCGFVISPDLGETWAEYDLKEFGPRSGCRFSKQNRDGWFRVDLRKGWIDRGEVLFIKPKRT